MPFKENSFSTPEYQELASDPKCVVIISCEGCKTEPGYFNAIKRKLSENLKSLVEIELVKKPNEGSDPRNVLQNLENHITAKFDFKQDIDILWLVIDRESVESRRNAILEILPICKEKDYKIALSNPTFEFWLLLHVAEIFNYDAEVLHANEKVSQKRRFLDKELSNILDQGFNKSNFNEDIVSLENIRLALKQEKSFSNTLPELLDSLGSNMGNLISDFLIVD